MKTKLPIESLKKYGFDTVERVVAMVFKRHYKGDWKKAIILAHIEGDYVTYEVTE